MYNALEKVHGEIDMEIDRKTDEVNKKKGYKRKAKTPRTPLDAHASSRPVYRDLSVCIKLGILSCS